MASRVPRSDVTPVSSTSNDVSDDTEVMRVLPRDESPPWSPHHLRGINAGLGQAACPKKGCKPSSSDNTSVCTPTAIDLLYGLTEFKTSIGFGLQHEGMCIDAMSTISNMSLDAQCGCSCIDVHDADNILKAFGASLESDQQACGGKPSYYQAQVELDDDFDGRSEPEGLWPHVTADKPVAAGRLHQLPDVFRILDPTHLYNCATESLACVELRVGWYGCIPRWRKGAELHYIVCTESFPPLLALVVEGDMKKAISMWQGIGASFKQVSRDAPATFAVRYDSGIGKTGYACSFLPRTEPAELLVHENSRSKAEYLPNILAHEVGHILGFRHGFAHRDEWYNPSSLVGSEDDRSVMLYYNHPREHNVSELDRQGAREFYAYDQDKYDGLLIVDVEPKLHDFGEANISSPAMRESAADISRRYSH